jgi:hypothetical protein
LARVVDAVGGSGEVGVDATTVKEAVGNIAAVKVISNDLA